MTISQEIVPVEPQGAIMPLVNAQALQRMRSNVALVVPFVEQDLDEGVDWGYIPGVDGPILQEPGADKLFGAFNSYSRPIVLQSEVDEEKKLITYMVEAEVIDRSSGQVVATGIGTASTREGKYGARWVRNPEEFGYGKEGLRSRKDDNGNPYQWKIPNPEWADLVHTLLQMAYKRARVDAAQALPGVSSALRRFFNNEGKLKGEYKVLWSMARNLRLSEAQVHEMLGVESVKDWVAQGKTVAQAREMIGRKVQEEKRGKPVDSPPDPAEGQNPLIHREVGQRDKPWATAENTRFWQEAKKIYPDRDPGEILDKLSITSLSQWPGTVEGALEKLRERSADDNEGA